MTSCKRWKDTSAECFDQRAMTMRCEKRCSRPPDLEPGSSLRPHSDDCGLSKTATEDHATCRQAVVASPPFSPSILQKAVRLKTKLAGGHGIFHAILKEAHLRSCFTAQASPKAEAHKARMQGSLMQRLRARRTLTASQSGWYGRTIHCVERRALGPSC